MKEVTISADLEESISKIVLESLLPELSRAVSRTQVNISKSGTGIILKISADDSSALRAAINSYLRWLDCIISTVTTFNPNQQTIKY
jgi:tRNA threonylcarbamoyladenosine modification (KEOPS) complex  Pcc1 subunit